MTLEFHAVSFDEAIDILDGLIEGHSVLPTGYYDTHQEITSNLSEAAHQLNIHTFAEAITSSRDVIANATGIDASKLTQFQSRESADQIHMARNTLAAIGAAVAIDSGRDPEFGHADIAPICVRGSKARCLATDEIVLLRLFTLHDLFVGGRRTIAAARYILTEAGLYPSETTIVTPSSFKYTLTPSTVVRNPTTVAAPGVKTRATLRTIDLDGFASGCLAPVIAEHMTRHDGAEFTPFAYTGCHKAGGHEASASASTGLRRLLKRAGIDHNVEPLGITQWRIQHTASEIGISRAITLAGKKSSAALGTLLKIQLDEPRQEPAHEGGFLSEHDRNAPPPQPATTPEPQSIPEYVEDSPPTQASEPVQTPNRPTCAGPTNRANRPYFRQGFRQGNFRRVTSHGGA